MSVRFISDDDTVKNSGFITPWAFIHLLSGLIIYLYLKFIFRDISIIIAFMIMIVIHTIYELYDLLYYFKITKNNTYWANNSLVNSIGDTVFAIIGFFIATQIKDINIYVVISCTIFYILTMIVFVKLRLH